MNYEIIKYIAGLLIVVIGGFWFSALLIGIYEIFERDGYVAFMIFIMSVLFFYLSVSYLMQIR